MKNTIKVIVTLTGVIFIGIICINTFINSLEYIGIIKENVNINSKATRIE
jgi:hypothetical protein